jgi:hypothetical protein
MTVRFDDRADAKKSLTTFRDNVRALESSGALASCAPEGEGGRGTIKAKMQRVSYCAGSLQMDCGDDGCSCCDEHVCEAVRVRVAFSATPEGAAPASCAAKVIQEASKTWAWPGGWGDDFTDTFTVEAREAPRCTLTPRIGDLRSSSRPCVSPGCD